MIYPLSLLEIERLRTATDARAESRRAGDTVVMTVVSGASPWTVVPGAVSYDVPNDRARDAA